MQSTQALRDQAAKLLAADATTLAPAMNGNKVSLFMNNFVPSETMTLANFMLATFTGSTALTAGTGSQPEGLDPATLDSEIDILAPAGGWRWITGDAMNLPQTIYGFILTDHAIATVYGAALLPAPITLTAAGEVIYLPRVYFRLLANSLQ